jgi:serine phosphatase RsbU (regulator of sigma subunit)/putative methionine-R-sulfoxide reductase with GAF domain
MQYTLEVRKVSYIGKSGNPKIYTNNSTVYTAAYPLIVQDTLLGVIQVIRNDSQPLSEDEIEYFEGLSANAAVSILISHHNIIKSWRLEQLSLVRSVSSKIANSQNLDDLANQVTSLIQKSFQYYAVSLFTTEPGTNHLLFRACSASDFEYKDAGPGFETQLGKGLVGTVANTGIEIVANDTSRETRFSFNEKLPHTQAEAVIPIKVEDRILGVLDIQSDHIYAFHEMDMMVLRSLADNIALAVEGARLYAGLGRKVEEMAIVAEVGRALSSILDFDRLLQHVVDIIYEKFHYPFVHLFLLEDNPGRIKYQAGAGERSIKLNKDGLEYLLEDTHGIIPLVARNRKTIIANDVGSNKHYRPSALIPVKTSSEMAIPLIFAEEVMGVLDIQSDQINRFDEEDKFLFEALADSIAIAIRNSRLYNAEKWRRQASDSLREVAGLLPSNMDAKRLMDVILLETEKILPCSASAIWLLNDTNWHLTEEINNLELAAVHNVDPDLVNKTFNENPESSIWLKKSIYNDSPLIRNEGDPMEPLGWSLGYINEYSAIAAPLKVGSQPLGILVLINKSSGRYGIESSQLTSAFASYAAVAIQNARLYSSAQEQAWVSTVLLQVADATQSLNSIDELLSAVVRLTPMLVGIKSCAVFMWENSLSSFILSAEHGIQYPLQEKDSLYLMKPEDAPALQQILDTKAAVFIDNIEDSIPNIYLQNENKLKCRVVLLPLVSRGSILGACLVAYSIPDTTEEIDPVENEKLAIIQGIAHQTAIAIENIKLLETQQQETYISAALLQVAQTVVSHSDMDDLFASIVQLTRILVGSEFCLIYMWDEDEQIFRLGDTSGIRKQLLEETNQQEVSAIQFPLLEYIRKQDKMSVLPICTSNPDDPLCWVSVEIPAEAGNYNFELNNDPLLIGMPLSVKGEVYGVLLVKDPGTDKLYLQKRLEMLTGIAQQTALAIQNDRLQSMAVVRERLEREFQIAREIQQTFLPSELPSHQNWKLDVRWRPAREVGGDFYDVFVLPDGRLAILVADVTDKGMSAALYMTVTRTLLRTVAQQLVTPAEILSSVNELLLRDTPHGMYITAFLGLLDLKSGEFFYANAGHNLPICKHPDGQMVKLLKGGMPLGIMEGLSLSNHMLVLDRGDTVILFTDGVTEAYIATDYFGDHRLEAAIKAARDQEPETILDSIDKALVDFQESEIPSDDVTILAVHHCERKQKN